jgi:flagellar protein FliO/FliZ
MKLRTAISAAMLVAADGARAADPGLEGSGIQALLGLVAVLATIAGAACLLRRFANPTGSGRGPLQTVAVLAVGTKERVVLIECRDTWIMVGVAQGRVNALHSMPKPEAAMTGDATAMQAPDIAATAPGFRQWLDKALKNRGR